MLEQRPAWVLSVYIGAAAAVMAAQVTELLVEIWASKRLWVSTLCLGLKVLCKLESAVAPRTLGCRSVSLWCLQDTPSAGLWSLDLLHLAS